MIDLLQLYDCALLQALEGQRLSFGAVVSVLDETDSAESTSSKGRQDPQIIQEVNIFLLPLNPLLNFLRGLIIMHYAQQPLLLA